MIRWQGNDLILLLYLQPNASQNKVVGRYQDRIKVQITAPPRDNHANKHLRRWLAEQFKVSFKEVEVQQGAQSRYKKICIRGPAQLPNWVEDFF